ncbi:MAG: hypothetical protein ABFD76_15390 [Smithella sp.]
MNQGLRFKLAVIFIVLAVFAGLAFQQATISRQERELNKMRATVAYMNDFTNSLSDQLEACKNGR